MKLFFCFNLLIFSFLTSIAQDQEIDYRNFYGIVWRGNAHENLAYARQMSYSHVFYQQGMENDTLSNGLYFYIETPEYLIYKRGINKKKRYDSKDKDFYENYCRIANVDAAFPINLATGWFFDDTNFSAELDFQKKFVVKWAVAKIIAQVKEIQAKNPKFRFAGYAWDVPQLSGDFWSAPQKKGGRQIVAKSIPYANLQKDWQLFSNYEEGKTQFYKALFSETKSLYANAHFIMEPYNIYEGWLKALQNNPNAKAIMPDILCQEGAGSNFIDDRRIFDTGQIDRGHVINTTPNVFSEQGNRMLAAKAAINGAWFAWYGRFGGTGDMPNFKSIVEVPARLKLIRVLSAWENLNKIALKDRHWDGSNYNSPTALASPSVIALKKPNTRKVFIVFLSNKGTYQLPSGKCVDKIFNTDTLFRETSIDQSSVLVKNSMLTCKEEAIGKGYIIYLK